MRHEESAMVLVFGTGFCVVLLWVIGKFISWIISLFGPRIPEQMPDQLGEALRVVGTPIIGPGGRWVRYETKLVECDAPMAPNSLDVHDMSSPSHDARTCRHCQRKPGFSGVSYRSN